MKLIEIKILVTDENGITAEQRVTLREFKDLLEALSYEPRDESSDYSVECKYCLGSGMKDRFGVMDNCPYCGGVGKLKK